MLTIGLCYAELASRFPAVSGGANLYTYTSFNELTAFLVFAQLMLDYHIGAASIARNDAVITGTVPYKLLGEDAPLVAAFTSKGMKYVSILTSVGAVAGLTTTLLVGLYVQAQILPVIQKNLV